MSNSLNIFILFTICCLVFNNSVIAEDIMESVEKVKKQSEMLFLGQWENKLFFSGPVNSSTSFGSARYSCIQANMTLTMPKTFEERMFLMRNLPSWNSYPWIDASMDVGVSYNAGENYQWTDKTSLSNELTVYQQFEYNLCLALYDAYSWFVDNCQSSYGVLCQILI